MAGHVLQIAIQSKYQGMECEPRHTHGCEYGDDGQIGVPMAHIFVRFCWAKRDLPVIVIIKMYIVGGEGGRGCFFTRSSIKISANGM